MAWLANVDERWHEIADNYSACAGGFRARHMQLWQVVFSRGRLGRYDAPR
ncbi:hypothetical protein [Halomonas salifodinae]